MNNISVYWAGCSTNLLDMRVSYACVDVLGEVNTVVAFQLDKNSWKTQVNTITQLLM